MAPHGREDAAPVAEPTPAAGRRAPAAPGGTVPLDPLIFALSRAVDRLGPGQRPDPHPDISG